MARNTRQVWLGTEMVGVIQETTSLKKRSRSVWVPIPDTFEVDDIRDAQREFGEYGEPILAAIALGRYILEQGEW
jgi:hypothetical protein